MSRTTERLFVYGTLRSECPKRPIYMPPTRTLFHGSIRGTLVDFGPYPALLSPRTADSSVRGEVIEIDAALLPWFDTYESHPRLYVRRLVSVQPDKPTLPLTTAWAYFAGHRLQDISQHYPVITSGDWFKPNL